MDFEEISGPKVPDVLYPLRRPDIPEPVQAKTRLSAIRPRVSPFEHMDRWNIRDKVTISPEARRRYRQLQSLTRHARRS